MEIKLPVKSILVDYEDHPCRGWWTVFDACGGFHGFYTESVANQIADALNAQVDPQPMTATEVMRRNTREYARKVLEADDRVREAQLKAMRALLEHTYRAYVPSAVKAANARVTMPSDVELEEELSEILLGVTDDQLLALLEEKP